MKAIVTDDSKATRMILRRMLEDLGLDVTEAEDGHQLFALLEKGVPDLALVDWNMPGPNGTEVIATMAGTPAWSGVPAILVTDETATERIESALDAGAKGYLAKPFELNTLREMLTELGIEL